MMSKTSLPPGFRFHPTDVELVWYYLKRKVMGKPFRFEAISEVELYKFAPWELPEKSQLCTKDLEWYFFCPRDRKYPNGSRTNRMTNIGYWKATGRDRSVIHNSHKVGTKKTLIFHVGKPPKGNRTDWVMYEYRLEDKEFIDAGFSQDAYVLCKIFQKSGPGPKTGEQYGAPFNEEDWEDDTTTKSSFPLPSVSCPSPEPIDDQAITLDPVSQQPMASTVPDVSSDPDLLDTDGIFPEELAAFLNMSPLRENANGEMPDSTIIDTNDNEASVMDPEGTHNELEDISVQTVISANINHPENILSEIALQPMLSELDNEQYMELNDFYFIWDGGPSENIMPNDTFAQNPSAHSPNFWTPSHIHDPTFYFDNDVSGMCDLQAEPDMSKQYSPRMQIGDFWGFTPHLNVPVSYYQHYHLLEEFPPAS